MAWTDSLIIIRLTNPTPQKRFARLLIAAFNVNLPWRHRGEQIYSSALSLTSALNFGRRSTPHRGRFGPTKETRYPLYSRLCGPQVWFGRVRKISLPPGFEPRTVIPVANRYTDWAIPSHTFINALTNELSFLLFKSFSFLFRFFPLNWTAKRFVHQTKDILNLIQETLFTNLHVTDDKRNIIICSNYFTDSSLLYCTDKHRLTTGIRSEKCVVRQFGCCANVIECTYLYKPR